MGKLNYKLFGLPLPDDDIDSDTEGCEYFEAREEFDGRSKEGRKDSKDTFEIRRNAHEGQVPLPDLDSVQIAEVW